MATYKGKFVSRAGEKINAALDAFELDVSDLVCADFGCNVGGFTDCLLQRGASKIYAVDTGYGALAWKLRKDDRVEVMERTNALHTPAPELVDMVVIDLAWTCQIMGIPAATKWLKPAGKIVSLLKPSFEYPKIYGKKSYKPISDAQAQEIVNHVTTNLHEAGYPASAVCNSPIRGKGGNLEFLLLFEAKNLIL